MHAREEKMFHTVLYPDKPQIEIPATFKKIWYKKLKTHEHAWLVHPDGEKTLVHLNLYKFDSYLSSGIIVSQNLNVNEPTEIILEYEEADNRFKVTVIKNEKDDILKTIPNAGAAAEKSNAQAITQSTFNSAIINPHLLDFNFHGAYKWEKKVTKANACRKKNQPLYVPRDGVRHSLQHKEFIVVQCAHCQILVKCKISPATRDDNNTEKYITTGWNDFVKHKKPKVDDKMEFELNQAGTVLRVKFVNNDTNN
ncbi:unnamed protein product [Trifolium pratense]|uniref:Uncharacterized protein n=1 Tax=Trifolium pratense TaxID=57577 RepID=A0ACB0L7G2_TRIPR|nr:unnamed protein product [Trifolium pratense]